ncbi:MAG: hypothetical protein U0804_00765 [Gemmataceae bacterium]
MKWTHRAFLLTVALGLVPMLMAPCVASMTITPNPAPAPTANKLKGQGFYTVGANEMFGFIKFETTLKGTTQVTSATANTNAGLKSWDSTLQVAAGTYNPTKAIVHYLDANMKSQTTVTTSIDDQIVK